MPVNEHPIEQEEMMAFLDGELPPDQAIAAASHIEECGECQKLVAELRNVSRQLSGWRIEQHSAWLPSDVAAALARSRSKSRLWKWSWLVGGLAGGCVLLLVLVLPRMPAPSNRAMLRQGMEVQQEIEQQAGSVMAYGTAQTRRHQSSHALEFPLSSARRGASVLPPKPMIAQTSQIVLIAKELDKARGALEDILKRHRGYVGQLEVTAPPEGPRTLNATLKVPADQLELAIKEIKGLGQVESESQSGQEVSQQNMDLDARLRNARNTEQRLNALLHEHTGQMSDVLAVENEIDRIRGQIEGMDAEKKDLLNRVDFAALTVTVREAAKAGIPLRPSSLEQLRSAALDGYTTLAAGAVAVAAFLLAYGPSLLLWGGLAFFGLRFLLKRLRLNALD